ncbi:hypothetical protein ACFVYV_50760 [Streptomyces mirabilis]|uniref:hypothetical protein n=1 Tax=Streptomyces mirabilis TaxID=68239 RepID=UPI0036D9906D
MTLTAIVALSLAVTTVFFVERRGEGLGTAIVAGAAVLGAIMLFLNRQDAMANTPPKAPDTSITIPAPVQSPSTPAAMPGTSGVASPHS